MHPARTRRRHGIPPAVQPRLRPPANLHPPSGTHVEVSTVSRAASALERHGIIERIPDPADGRAHLLSLTDDGPDALGALQEQRQEWFSELLSDWRAEDVAQLRELLTRFLGDCVEAYRNKAL